LRFAAVDALGARTPDAEHDALIPMTRNEL
jgi:hypothetical protein